MTGLDFTSVDISEEEQIGSYPDWLDVRTKLEEKYSIIESKLLYKEDKVLHRDLKMEKYTWIFF